jgi:site-specific DNA recombinase
MMVRAALYARVSSDRQARQATIGSQLAELRDRLRADGIRFAAGECVDEGVGGATLARPGLERLRDLVTEGSVDRVYIHTPDRLARKYAYQVLLLEEFARAGVEVIFLHGTVGDDSPEGALLKGVQGVIAEYERIRILERTRRGRLHRARAGHVSTLCQAPFGFNYVRRTGGGADYVVDEHEARTVRDAFRLLGVENLALREIARRFTESGVKTRNAGRWTAATVLRIIVNPAYKGEAQFGKTTAAEAHRQVRPPLGAQSHRTPARRPRPEAERILIPVPAIVTVDEFQAANEQLARNRAFASRGAKRESYLLQGLLRCGGCKHAYCGKATRTGTSQSRYYRCTGRASQRDAGLQLCASPGVRTDLLDAFVWSAVVRVLEDPTRVAHEWNLRNEADGTRPDLQNRRDAAARAVAAAERVVTRLIDAYEAGVIDVDTLKVRSERATARVRATEAELALAEGELHQRVVLAALVNTVEAFAARVREGLAAADFATRQKIVRALVREIVINGDEVRIVYQIPSTTPTGTTGAPGGGPTRGLTQNVHLCSGGHDSTQVRNQGG